MDDQKPVVKKTGRPVGVPNKSTTKAREAIAAFVDANTPRMQEWLDRVAMGVPLLTTDGIQGRDKHGNLLWHVAPNPEKAFNMLRDMAEYHVPKLARKEVTGADGGAITLTNIGFKNLTDDELDDMQRLMAKAVTSDD